MSHLIGIDPTNTFTALGSKTFKLGERSETQDGKQWIFVKASGSISQYDVVTYGPDFTTLAASVTTSNALRGNKLGVAAVAIASGSYGWLQIYGPCTFNAKTLCAANVALNTTATAGAVDDDATASSKIAGGLFVTTTNSTSATAATPGILNYPEVENTL